MAIKLTLAIGYVNPFRFVVSAGDASRRRAQNSVVVFVYVTVVTSHTDLVKSFAVFVVAILMIRITHNERTTWYPCHVGFENVGGKTNGNEQKGSMVSTLRSSQ